MSVNKWIGIGNLTKAPELKYTGSGTAVCSFSIACNERFKDRDGNQQEKVEFVNIVTWRQLAEICSNYLVKGKQVYIEGKLQTRSYDDRDGNKRYVTEIVASEMKMLGSRSDDRQQSKTPQQSSQSPQAPQQGGYQDDQDSIPF